MSATNVNEHHFLPQASLGVGVLSTPFLADLLHSVSNTASFIAVVTGAIVGSVAVVRLVRGWMGYK